MRIGRNGRVTIPHAMRKKLGFHPGTEVEVVFENGEVYIQKKPRRRKSSAAAGDAGCL